MDERRAADRSDIEAVGQPGAEQRWYACYTRSRHEKQVDRLLIQRGIECYLPLVPRVSQWKDRKRTVKWPMFPSYVFGRFALGDLYQVLGVPGMVTVVRVNGQPVPIRAEDLENVMRFARALAHVEVEAELRPYVAEGQWVRVMEGPFEGVVGIVIERRNKKRVLIGLEAIRQGLAVDIDTKLLEPIADPRG